MEPHVKNTCLSLPSSIEIISFFEKISFPDFISFTERIHCKPTQEPKKSFHSAYFMPAIFWKQNTPFGTPWILWNSLKNVFSFIDVLLDNTDTSCSVFKQNSTITFGKFSKCIAGYITLPMPPNLSLNQKYDIHTFIQYLIHAYPPGFTEWIPNCEHFLAPITKKPPLLKPPKQFWKNFVQP